MNRAHIPAGSYLQALPSTAFNFGAGDFTVMAMVVSQQGGTAVARKGTAGGAGNGGFLLVINPDGSVKFTTDNGLGFYQTLTGPTSVLDGNCHTIAGIRTSAALSILIDGIVVPSTSSGNASSPLDVNNNLPLTIGCTQQSQEPSNQFVGDIMNVSVWSAALSGDQLVQSAFARVTGSVANLAGYWTLDATSEDLSPNGNSANIIGMVTFEYCLDCVWAASENAYRFCRIANVPDSHAPTTNITISHEIVVPTGAPALGMAILATQDVPAFPDGAQVVLQDPSGHIYNQAQNTDTVFAALSGEQLWALMVVNPAEGAWRVTVTTPATTAFSLSMQTVPSAAVVRSSRDALQPLFGIPVAHGHEMTAIMSVEGFWDFVTYIAVGVAVGVVAAGAVLLTGGAALPAVAAGIGAFAITEGYIAAAALPAIDSGSLSAATGQVAGMAGFIIAADKFLLLDANVDADEATQRIYRQRLRKLYPQVTASSFNKVQSQWVGPGMTRVNVKTSLLASSNGYVTACGHGLSFSLTGWYQSGTSGPLQDVIATVGSATFQPAEVQGKIFHFFACNCGYAGTATSPGLGRAMVAAGAISFFGYNVPFIINIPETPAFCDCDIKIDLEMIAGATCDAAYTKAIALFDSTIATLRANGNTQAAAQLESNRNALVAPSTDTMYGNKTACLRISSSIARSFSARI